MQTVAVVLAAGSGRRFGSPRPKQLGLLAGRTLVEHSVAAFDQAPQVDQVLVVTAPEITAEVATGCAPYQKVAAIIHGGVTRADSTRAAIAWLRQRAAAWRPERCGAGEADRAGRPDSPGWKVLFHDAARPLVDQETITRTIAALDRWDAVGVVVPSADTIVTVADGAITRVLPRAELARCQTPQGFRLPVIAQAYERADADPGFATTPPTDDCGVVLRYLPDVPVGVVPGSDRNLKITYPGDLLVAESLLDG